MGGNLQIETFKYLVAYLITQKMKVKCKRCKKEWDYTGTKIKLMEKYPQYISCPRCNTSVKLIKEGL